MREYCFHGYHNSNKKGSFQCTVQVIEILSSKLIPNVNHNTLMHDYVYNNYGETPLILDEKLI